MKNISILVARGFFNVSIALDVKPLIMKCLCIDFSAYVSGYDNQLHYRKTDDSYPPYRNEGTSTWYFHYFCKIGDI